MSQQTEAIHLTVSETLEVHNVYSESSIKESMSASWKIIAPIWPLQGYIARNPLSGLENTSFIEALNTASEYFENIDIPEQMLAINRETIKWCQAYFDLNQSTISMPLREKSLYIAWKRLAIHDLRLHAGSKNDIVWLKSLPDDPLLTIKICLEKIGVPSFETTRFFTLLLATLPGWAGYVKYLVDYSEPNPPYYRLELIDYISMRLATLCLLWPQAAEILNLQLKPNNSQISVLTNTIIKNESHYRIQLLNSLRLQANEMTGNQNKNTPKAQLVFCIDVRSEQFRRAIEAQGHYETFSYAGFFGVPVSISKYGSAHYTDSCPVLIKSKHKVREKLLCDDSVVARYNVQTGILGMFKSIYKSLKYGFTTPFTLVEFLGPMFGIFMGLRTLNGVAAVRFRNYVLSLIRPALPIIPSKHDISDIAFSDRCRYAKNILVMTGLVDQFAPVILLCGHKSSTENNPYASALDCGACGGNKGGFNAQVMANILNEEEIRDFLCSENILIPTNTRFVAAEHNTTTDEVVIFDYAHSDPETCSTMKQIEVDLLSARKINNYSRANQMNIKSKHSCIVNKIFERSVDWSQTRPEWGLARNASFIIAPRSLTKNIDLDGRSFLHSYNWQYDSNGNSLEAILTAPMIVAQWINNQYLFSTANNIAYGSGSKVTQNITGKMGVMQGNASDLMHGLPLQSVNINDLDNYHELLRMITIVYAPVHLISTVIAKHSILQSLFGNSWVHLSAIDPLTNNIYTLNTDLTWRLEL